MALILKSQRQIQTDILNAIISRLGLTDVNPGSVLDLLTQAVSQEDFNQYVQMSQIVRLVDLDATTGVDLDNRAFEYGLTRNAAVQSNGTVTITRLTTTGSPYVKISTTFVSAGVLAPSQGDDVLNLNSTQFFIAGGGNRVVIGRGLANEEIRNIDSRTSTIAGDTTNTLTISPPLAFDHSFTEEVTLLPPAGTVGGDDISVSAGTVVSVPSTGTNAQIDFNTSEDQTLFAGEASLININVRALEPGARGNVGTGTISIIDLEGLSVTNTTAFTTGQDLETDAALRDRIRSHIQSLSRGTKQAILNAIVGLVDAASSKRVVSANVVLPQTTDESVKIFIDDGTGFEPTFSPQASEALVEDSTRGTSRLQLDFAPVVKAQIESANSEPFVLTEINNAPADTGLQLNVRIGGVGGREETISVLSSDIEFPSTVRAEEIVKVINNKATIFEARTSETGTKIVVTAVSDTNEDIFVNRIQDPMSSPATFRFDLNTYLQLTNAEQSTAYIYKNDVLLNKDGLTAAVTTPSNVSAPFNVANQILNIEVDRKTSNVQVVTFAADATALSLNQAVEAINSQVTGVIASPVENGTRLELASGTRLSGASSIRILTPATGTNANGVFMFPTARVDGRNSDYTLNRELGTIELTQTLVDGDTITAGNAFSRATLRTPNPVSAATRINQGVGFTLAFDNAGGSDVVSRNVIFSDDRFAASFLDDPMATPVGKFGFNKLTDIDRLPQFIADYVTKQIYPFGKAVLRQIGNDTFIEIRTNTLASNKVQSSEASNNTNGTIQLSLLDNAGTDRQLGIWQGVPTSLIDNQRPHTAFRENTVTKTYRRRPLAGATTDVPDGYIFSPTDTLVTVINNDQANGTFVLPAGRDTRVSAIESSTTEITASELAVIYGSGLSTTDIDYSAPTTMFPDGKSHIPADADLRDFFIAFTGLSLSNIDEINTPNDRNSLAISASGGFRVPSNFTGLTVPVSASNEAQSTIGILVSSATAADLTFREGDILTFNTTVPSVFSVTSVTLDNSNPSTPFFSIVLAQISGTLFPAGGTNSLIAQRTVIPREASPVLSVSVTGTTSTYTIGTASTAGAGQLMSSDFGNAQMQIGDIVTFSEMGNSVNDGTFIITALSSMGTPTIEVTNPSGAIEIGASGIAILGQKRRISNYNFRTGVITIDSTIRMTDPGRNRFGAFRDNSLLKSNNPVNPSAPDGDLGPDQFNVIVNTVPNIQMQLDNSRLSSLSSQTEVSATDRGRRVQISSLMEGSAGFVEITGGVMNNLLLFSTAANRGLQGYNYYTGLLALVHNTIYGDDTDLITFPGVGAAGINFQVIAPTVTEIILGLDITLQEGISIAAVENEVNTAMTGYVNGLGVGEDVIVEELRARTIRINGITDVVITRLIGGDSTITTISNIAIADNEIARIKVSDITIG